MTKQTISNNGGWQVYILCCADSSLYTGITTDLKRRVEEHNSHTTSAARYTRSRQPVKLVYHEQASSRTEAAKREYVIKQLSRSLKLALIATMQCTNTETFDNMPTSRNNHCYHQEQDPLFQDEEEHG